MNTCRVLCLISACAWFGIACASKTPPPTAASFAASKAADDRAAAAMPPPTPGLRSHTAILGDAIRAIGSPEAWRAHKSMRVTMEMTFQGMGITGTVERVSTSSDKTLAVTNIPGVGVIREGSNGTVYWSQDPIHGLRVLEGAEAEQARIDSAWNPELRLNDLYRKVESKNETTPDGKRVECLVLTPRTGAPTTSCYDEVSHLQALQKGIRPTPQGDTPFTSMVSDWREVGGLKMAYALQTQAGPITFKATLKSVTFDEPVDDRIFEPPSRETAAPPASTKPAAKPAGVKRKPKAGNQPKP